jgi:hypothetical protein
MRLAETIQVKSNLALTCRERGKIVDRRVGHNIFLDLGREWLASLITYASYNPDVTIRDDRVKYMGLGIGGTAQVAPGVANAEPLLSAYPGTNSQTDVDSTVTVLERPVRLRGSVSPTPGVAGDEWIGLIGSADPVTIPTQVTFTRIFTQTEVSYGPYVSVPLAEIGLFTAAAAVDNYQNNPVAYDTFDTLSKTTAFELEVVWTLRF